jgi:hypothetical protein
VEWNVDKSLYKATVKKIRHEKLKIHYDGKKKHIVDTISLDMVHSFIEGENKASIQKQEKNPTWSMQSKDPNEPPPNMEDGGEMYFSKSVRKIINKNQWWSDSPQPSVECTTNEAMQIECVDGCNGGENCNNKKIQRCEVKMVSKKKLGEKGFGLFADEDISKGEYVIEYIGKIVQKDPGNEYTMKYKEFNLWNDARKSKSLAKFINHSCNPNCVNEMWAVKGIPRLCFFAKRNIHQGEEITFSYGWTLPAVDLSQGLGTTCLCRDDSCLGTIEHGRIISTVCGGGNRKRKHGKRKHTFLK